MVENSFKILYTVVSSSGMEDFFTAYDSTRKETAVKRGLYKEGDVYRILTAFGKRFVIKYGYYEEYERDSTDPIPIYPDFQSSPQYTDGGCPFVTQMQDMCEHGQKRSHKLYDECCGNCIHFEQGDEMIGRCVHEKCREQR